MKFFYKIPQFISSLFPFIIFRIKRKEKNVFLTFDDGPIPEITPWILDVLKDYHAKATFFCVGDNIFKYPEIFKRIMEEGHTIGNHTFNHINGWKNNTSIYLENIDQCEEQIKLYSYSFSKFFRPPYGKIKPIQIIKLLKKGYKIVLWDVLSGDFDPNVFPDECYQNVVANISNGSIIVLHDNLKAIENVKYTLPKVLEYLKNNGYQCEKL